MRKFLMLIILLCFSKTILGAEPEMGFSFGLAKTDLDEYLGLEFENVELENETLIKSFSPVFGLRFNDQLILQGHFAYKSVSYDYIYHADISETERASQLYTLSTAIFRPSLTLRYSPFSYEPLNLDFDVFGGVGGTIIPHYVNEEMNQREMGPGLITQTLFSENRYGFTAPAGIGITSRTDEGHIIRIDAMGSYSFQDFFQLYTTLELRDDQEIVGAYTTSFHTIGARISYHYQF